MNRKHNFRQIPQDLLDIVAVSPESKTGLIWTSTNGKRRAGNPVGSTSNGYWIVGFNKTTYPVHRVVWTVAHGPIPEGMVIDHIDGDPSNNNLSNLRLATSNQNGHNKRAVDRDLPKNVYETVPGYFQVILMANGVTHRHNTKDLTEATWVAHLLREEHHGTFMRDL